MNKISKNPMIKELTDLGAINKKNLKIFFNKTRDANMRSFIDKRTSVIFLEKFVKKENFYKKKKTNRKVKNKKSFSNIKLKKFIKTANLNDDRRRYFQFFKYINKKIVLDFGCGNGNFILSCKKDSKEVNAVEVNEIYLKNLKKKIVIKEKIEHFESKLFDTITMFHVLEHLPNQKEIIKKLLNKLKKNGKLIIEIPSAHDFLLKIKNLISFKNFTMWSEHLVLHTYDSLNKLLKSAGAKNIKIQYYQRYNFSNHYGWLVDELPGGHDKYKFNLKFNQSYLNFLEENKMSDTLIAIIKK